MLRAARPRWVRDKRGTWARARTRQVANTANMHALCDAGVHGRPRAMYYMSANVGARAGMGGREQYKGRGGTAGGATGADVSAPVSPAYISGGTTGDH